MLVFKRRRSLDVVNDEVVLKWRLEGVIKPWPGNPSIKVRPCPKLPQHCQPSPCLWRCRMLARLTQLWNYYRASLCMLLNAYKCSGGRDDRLILMLTDQQGLIGVVCCWDIALCKFRQQICQWLTGGCTCMLRSRTQGSRGMCRMRMD